jgi:baculoviral IAP repeat-containing protein 5
MVKNITMNKESTGSMQGSNLMEKLHFLEQERVKTFVNWKYNDSEGCSAQKMAQAGFYYSGQNSDDDSATCFVCGKDLVRNLNVRNVKN